jgi:hypothetical protein
MIYDKARMAKLSGLLTETSHKGIKNSMANQFGGGKEEGDPWLDGEVTTEGAHDEDEGDMMHNESDDEEDSVREMIRNELRSAKNEMEQEQVEEQAVREAVRKEIRSVMKSRGVTLGGLGHGFKR